MKNILIVLTMCVFLSLLLAGALQAGCGMCASGTDKSAQGDNTGEGGIINTACPIMGNKVGKETPYSVEYKGNKIGLCCRACVKEFGANPDKYGKKVLDEKK